MNPRMNPRMNSPRRSNFFLVSLLVIGVLGFSLGWFSAKSDFVVPSGTSGTSTGGIRHEPFAVPIRNLDEVWKRLRESYYSVEKLDRGKLEYGAVKGFVSTIGDPYTAFLPPEESKEFESDLDDELEGIGTELEVREGKLIIVTALKESPAQKAGLKSGDIIYKIDGALAEEITFGQAVKKIRGKKGTVVLLTIIRENKPKPFDVTLTRQKIVIASVRVKKLDGDIFHIELIKFNNHTKENFQDAVSKILLEKAKGIILDMRNNGGGYLDTSVDILSELISGERVGAIIKKRNQADNETIKTNGSARIADLPLVVLVNRGSASASEIVAGAIQDYKRGIIMGEKTFGKGSVQELDKLGDGSTLRLTIAKWFTPLDRSIDEVGITPDKIIPLTEDDEKAKRDPQLDAAIKYLKTIKRK